MRGRGRLKREERRMHKGRGSKGKVCGGGQHRSAGVEEVTKSQTEEEKLRSGKELKKMRGREVKLKEEAVS